MDAWDRYCFDVIFVGDDWKGTDKWNSYEREFKPLNVDVVYIPYTKKISSTKIREKLQNKENQERDKKPA
jgi:FAD synthase